jgi:iron-sulfur cluster assembly protein
MDLDQSNLQNTSKHVKRKEIISVTPKAATEVKRLIAARGKPTAAIRVRVKTRGCSGLAYAFEYADTIDPADEVIQTQDVTVAIEQMAVMYVLGSVMDFVDGIDHRGFVFTNPNEKGRCGCGESFYI